MFYDRNHQIILTVEFQAHLAYAKFDKLCFSKSQIYCNVWSAEVIIDLVQITS